MDESSGTTTQAQKQKALESALERGKTQIRVDARRAGVRVPDRFADEPMLALNLSWRFPQTEMVVNERGVAATLRFDGTPFRCVLPWSSVWGLVPPNADLLVWQDDLPPELGGTQRENEEPPPPVEAMRPKLAVVSNAPKLEAVEPRSEEEDESPDDEPPTEPPRPRAPWLKLVQ